MARFLSAEWFGQLSHREPAGSVGPGPADLVIEVVVTGTPEAPQAQVSYQVVLQGDEAAVVPTKPRQSPQVRFTGDYATVAGIASGQLSAYEALSSGRTRISGEAGLLASRQPMFTGRDLLPAPLRASTTF